MWFEMMLVIMTTLVPTKMTAQDIDGLDAEAKLWIEFRCVVVGSVLCKFSRFCYFVLSGVVSLLGCC